MFRQALSSYFLPSPVGKNTAIFLKINKNPRGRAWDFGPISFFRPLASLKAISGQVLIFLTSRFARAN